MLYAFGKWHVASGVLLVVWDGLMGLINDVTPRVQCTVYACYHYTLHGTAGSPALAAYAECWVAN